MKNILLFTRVEDNREWEAWNKWAAERAEKRGNCNGEKIHVNEDNIIYTKDNISLEIRNGSRKLNNLGDPNRVDISGGDRFLSNLKKELENITSKEYIIAIHLSYGKNFEHLEKWFKKLEQNENLKWLKENFSYSGNFKNDKPWLCCYSTNGNDDDFIKKVTDNLEAFYNQLRGEPYNPILEVKLKLLHALLLPPKNIATFEQEDGLWCKLISQIREEEKQKYEIAWKNFKENLPTNDRNPFDEKYIDLLAKFRDTILSENEL